MTDIFKDLLQACPNIKAVVIHGEEPYEVIIKIGGGVPLDLIVNKNHNVAHGCRLSNNAYRSCEWIIYTDVIAEAVAILLDQDAIPLVTTEDPNEILLEPTWNSTEGKAARKRKRKDGMTTVKKAEEEAQCVVKIVKRDRKHAEKESEEEAQRVAKAERERMAAIEKGYENGIGAMAAEERMAAGQKGYENGIGAMSAEARMAAGEKSMFAAGIAWEEKYAEFKRGNAEERNPAI